MIIPKHITRKEISEETGLSVDTIRKSETRWGINLFRLPALPSPVRYWREKTLKKLKEIGLIA